MHAYRIMQGYFILQIAILYIQKRIPVGQRFSSTIVKENALYIDTKKTILYIPRYIR